MILPPIKTIRFASYLFTLPAIILPLCFQGCAATSSNKQLADLTPLKVRYTSADAWTPDSANAFLDAYERTQIVGDRLNDAVADSFSKYMILPPFMVLPVMDETFWKAVGKEGKGVVVTAVIYPDKLPAGSRVERGMQINAVEGKEVRDFYEYQKELQEAGRKRVAEVLMTFKNGQEIWSEKIPVRRQSHDMNFYVLNTKTKRAFSVQGPHVFVSLGFLEFVETQDELALILGHEIAHFRMGDYKRAGRIEWGKAIASGLATGAAMAVLNYGETHNSYANYQQSQQFGRMAADSVLKAFSQPQEERADRLGLYYLAEAGFDAEKAVKFWVKLEDAEDSKPAASHPGRLKRYQYLLEEAMAIRQMGSKQYFQKINMTPLPDEDESANKKRKPPEFTVANADKTLLSYQIPLEKAAAIAAQTPETASEALRVFMQLRFSGHAALAMNFVWPEYFDRMMTTESYFLHEIENKNNFLPLEAYEIAGSEVKNDESCLLILEVSSVYAGRKGHEPGMIELYQLVKRDDRWKVLYHNKKPRTEMVKSAKNQRESRDGDLGKYLYP